jgi:hypothetical protein
MVFYIWPGTFWGKIPRRTHWIAVNSELEGHGPKLTVLWMYREKSYELRLVTVAGFRAETRYQGVRIQGRSVTSGSRKLVAGPEFRRGTSRTYTDKFWVGSTCWCAGIVGWAAAANTWDTRAYRSCVYSGLRVTKGGCRPISAFCSRLMKAVILY